MRLWCAACVLAVAGLFSPPPAIVTVSAAISLTEALEASARAYEKSSGGEQVRFNFGGSNTLARQIVSGAPVDLFISADEAQMDVAAKAGAIVESTRVELLGNRLAVIVRTSGPQIRDVSALQEPSVRRIAIGDPAAVPAGVYAQRYLKAAGLWQALQGRLVPVANVRAATAAVENGSVDAAIAYVTDLAAARNGKIAFVVEGPLAPRIVYPAAIVRSSGNARAAARFLEFLRGAEATAVFKSYGFVPLAARK